MPPPVSSEGSYLGTLRGTQKVTFRLTTFSSGTIVLDPDGTEDGVNVDVDAASAAADAAVGVEVAAPNVNCRAALCTTKPTTSNPRG